MSDPVDCKGVERVGASCAEWDHWSLMLGLMADLLPVVSRAGAPIAAASSLRSVGKVPSRYNAQREVVGIPRWTVQRTTAAQVDHWCKEPDYGICLQTRRVRVIDVDVDDPALAGRVRARLAELLPVRLPVRQRAGSARVVLACSCPDDLRKRVVALGGGGAVELLAAGQQVVVAGTHPSGQRYEWAGGLPLDIPVVSAEQLGRALDAIERELGVRVGVGSAEGGGGAGRADTAVAGAGGVAGEAGRGAAGSSAGPGVGRGADRDHVGRGGAGGAGRLDRRAALAQAERQRASDEVVRWAARRGWLREDGGVGAGGVGGRGGAGVGGRGGASAGGAVGSDGESLVWCPWTEEHTGDSGETEAVWWSPGTGGYAQGHFHCLHAHCANRTDAQFLEAIGLHLSWLDDVEVIGDDDAAVMGGRRTGGARPINGAHRRDLVGDAGGAAAGGGNRGTVAAGAPVAAPGLNGVPVAVGSADAGAAGGAGSPVVPGVVADLPDDPTALWSASGPGAGLTRGRRGWLATVRNVSSALRTPGWWRRIAYDEFRDEVVWCDWRGPNASVWQPFDDDDLTELRDALERDGFEPPGAEVVRSSVSWVARRRRFDSAALWLGGLAWDGVPRVERSLVEWAGAEDNAYTRAVGCYLWTALAGRVLQPGCKADMVPILVGSGGAGKTRLVEAMAPTPEVFVRISLDMREADLGRLLRGKLVAELSELRGLHTRDSQTIKDFCSATELAWTPKYRERATTLLRRFVVVGTTDRREFLDDDASNERRWLPVLVGACSPSGPTGLASVVEQLWAEGAARWAGRVAGAPAGVDWSAAEMLGSVEGVREEFKIGDSWREELSEWIASVADDGDGGTPVSGVGRQLPTWGQKGFTSRDALVVGLGIPRAQVNRGMEMRVAKILRELNFERVRVLNEKNNPGKRVWIR